MKAFECLGYIREREGRWADAANNYAEAWRIGRRRNPAIG